MEQLFAGDDWHWSGGYYELDIDLGHHSEERLQLALGALWADPRLEGPYLDRTREPADQQVADPRGGVSNVLSGIATLPDGARVLCFSIAVWLDEGYELSLCVPVNALAVAWPQIGHFPFVGGRLSPSEDVSQIPEGDDRAWQEPLEEWLASFGKAIFDAVAFPAAVIGFEGGLLDDEQQQRLIAELPEERSVGILKQEQDALAWYPATVWGRIDVDWSQPPSWHEVFGLWRATWRLRLAVWRRELRRLFGSSEET